MGPFPDSGLFAWGQVRSSPLGLLRVLSLAGGHKVEEESQIGVTRGDIRVGPAAIRAEGIVEATERDTYGRDSVLGPIRGPTRGVTRSLNSRHTQPQRSYECSFWKFNPVSYFDNISVPRLGRDLNSWQQCCISMAYHLVGEIPAYRHSLQSWLFLPWSEDLPQIQKTFGHMSRTANAQFGPLLVPVTLSQAC